MATAAYSPAPPPNTTPTTSPPPLSPAGKKAQSFMDQGVLVPDEVVVEMVKSRLAADDVKQRGWLLDGYPRSASQAEAIEAEGIRPDCFLLIDVSFQGRRCETLQSRVWCGSSKGS